MPDLTESDVPERVAAVCLELERGDLQAIVAEIGAEDVLRRVMAALAPGADTSTLTDDLDALDARLIAYGIPGGLLPPTQRTYQPNPAARGGPYPAFTVWVCPTGHCNRWQPADLPGGAVPSCAAQGIPFIRKQIGR
nr:hypothetical protein [Kibdelosporangium sp. MJ126-NF4]